MKTKFLLLLCLLSLCMVQCKKDEPNSGSGSDGKYYELKVINKDASHRYEIEIDNGFYTSVIVGKKSTVVCNLPAGYHNIKLNQLDYILYPTNYEYGVNLYSNKSITINN